MLTQIHAPPTAPGDSLEISRNFPWLPTTKLTRHIPGFLQQFYYKAICCIQTTGVYVGPSIALVLGRSFNN